MTGSACHVTAQLRLDALYSLPMVILPTRTERLDLRSPRRDDLPELHAIYSDPRVWEHYPSLRHTDVRTSEAMLMRWIDAWRRDGLGPWIVRRRDTATVVGQGGCDVRGGVYWNLGYRFAPDAQGSGFATEVARAAVESARVSNPDLPIVALLLEHNAASRRVAEKVGLTLRYRGPDVGNP